MNCPCVQDIDNGIAVPVECVKDSQSIDEVWGTLELLNTYASGSGRLKSLLP